MRGDLSNFKVIYNEKVWRTVAIENIEFKDNSSWEDQYQVPSFIKILVLNEDGNFLVIRDEAWRFQFVPVIGNKQLI